MRDVGAMARLLSDDCYHFDLERSQPGLMSTGKRGIVDAYQRFVSLLPPDVEFKVEDMTTGSSNKVGVVWHMLLGGSPIANAHGVSWFMVDASNRICYVRESPEHYVRSIELLLPLLHAASPFVKAGAPVLLPTLPNLPVPFPPALPSLSDFFAQPEDAVAEVGEQLKAAVADGMRASLHALHGPVTSTFPFVEEWHSTLQSFGLPNFVEHAAPRPTHFADTGAQLAALAPAMASPSLTADKRDAAEANSSPQEDLFLTTSTGSTIAMRVLEPPQGRAALAQAPRISEEQSSEPASTSGRATGGRAESIAHAGALAGTWKKIPELSDLPGYGRALDLMGVGGIQKQTALMIDGMEVTHDADSFAVFFLTVVPYFKVTEAYKFNTEVTIGRRDLRSGGQKAIARQEGNRVVVDLKWDAPNEGTGHEEYWLNAEGQLCAESTVTVNGVSATTLQVYARQAGEQLDKRYFSEKRPLPFGIDPNKISGSLIKMFE